MSSERVTEISDVFSWNDLCKEVDVCNKRYSREKIRLIGEGENAVYYSKGFFLFRNHKYSVVTSNAGTIVREATRKWNYDTAAADILWNAMELYIDPD